MRVLQVHNTYRQPGGEDRVVENERQLLAGAGHEVGQLVVANPTTPAASAARLALAPWNPASAALVRRRIEEFRPDVVHIHNTWFSLSPAVVRSAARTGVPVVVTLHNYRATCIESGLLRDGRPCEICVGASPWNGVRYGCYRGSVLQSVPAAITVGRAAAVRGDVTYYLALTEFAREIHLRAGFPPDRVLVKPNFVTDPGPRPDPPSTGDLVLYAGRVEGQKGIDLLLRAWQRARPPGLRLVVAGDGDLRNELQAAHPEVEWIGWRRPAEVGALMMEARALVFPSLWYEGQSMTLLEAMASGLPVLASDWPPIRETLGEGGRLAIAGDVDAWAEALAGLTDDTGLDRDGSLLRRRYLEAFSPKQAFANLESVYRSALAARGATAG